jgi:hypothetical protein
MGEQSSSRCDHRVRAGLTRLQVAAPRLAALQLECRLKHPSQGAWRWIPALAAQASLARFSTYPEATTTWELIRRGLGHDSGATERARALLVDRCRSLYLRARELRSRAGAVHAQTSVAAARPHSDSSELARAKSKERGAFTQPAEPNSLQSQTA